MKRHTHNPMRMLALAALVVAGWTAAGVALAHPNHADGACSSGLYRANIPGGHPCLEIWNPPLVEWCLSVGLTPMPVPVNGGGLRTFWSGFGGHDDSDIILHTWGAQHWTCFIEQKTYWAVESIPDNAYKCSEGGYKLVVMQRSFTDQFFDDNDYDYFCMTPTRDDNRPNFRATRNGPHCMKKGELYRVDAHACTKHPTPPANVSARRVQAGLVEVSWDPLIKTDSRRLADYYIVEVTHHASGSTQTVRVEAPPTSHDRVSVEIRIDRPAGYSALDPFTFRLARYAFRVKSGVHRYHYGERFLFGASYFPDSDFSSDVVVSDVFNRRDTCAAQGWDLDVDGRTHWCNIPWENAADGTTGERCSISANQRPLWCGYIFGHNLPSDRLIEWEIPSRDSLPYGDRFLYNCPHNVSANFQECVCRPGYDNHPKEDGGYYCRKRLNCPAEQARENIDPYTCGVCLATHDEVDGVCRERLDCPADQFREQTSLYTCGICLEGYSEIRRADEHSVEHFCRPDFRITGRDISYDCPDARRLAFYSSTSVATIAAAATRVQTFAGLATFFDGTTRVATFVEGVEVGHACRLDASDDWCYALDYRQQESNAALTYFRLRPLYRTNDSTSQIHLPADAQSCDDKYPVCGGENYSARHPFAECACDAGFVQSNPAAPDNICTRNCAALSRDSGEGLRDCGACWENFVDDIDGGEHCQAVVDCSAENRQQRNGYQCAGCAAGFVEDDAGVCRERVACAAQNRQQRNGYQCAGCAAGFVEDDAGVCRERIACPAGRVQLNDWSCGGCLEDHTMGAGGVCRLTVGCEAQNRRQLDEHTCGACLSGLPDADGVCGATPLAAQCEASDGEIRNTAIELTGGECLPVQQCLRRPVPNNQHRTHECFLWSDTGRAEALADAHRNDIVWADASTSGVCVDRLTFYREADVRRIRRTCADTWAPAARDVAWNCGGSASLSDPDNVFSDCVNDYTQDACEAAGGEWKRTSHALDPLGSEWTDTCLIDGVGCWLNARSHFDPDATVFYDIDHPHHSTHVTEPDHHIRYPGSLSSSCEDLYTNNCTLAEEGNAYLGCSEVSRPGKPTFASLSDGAASLRWEASVVAKGSTARVRISGYTVFRQVRGGEWTQIGFAPEANYIDAEAPREREVRYHVRTAHSLPNTLTSAFSEWARIPGCVAAGHSAVARIGLHPLCVPDAAWPLAQLCANAGWSVLSNGFVRCGIGARDAQSGRAEHCGILGDYLIACSDPRLPFGDPPDFPTNNGVSRQYVFNCPANSVPDPDYASQNALVQQCVCDEGYFKDGDQCTACETIGRTGVPGQAGVCSTQCAEGAVPHYGACAAARSIVTESAPAEGGVVNATATAIVVRGGRLQAPHGRRVTFIATPAADYYVRRWSHRSCRSVGDETAPGVRKTCRFAVSADVTVTVTFALGLPRASAPKYFTAQLLPATNDGPTAVRFRWLPPHDNHTPQGTKLLPLRFRWLPPPSHTVSPALRYFFQRAVRNIEGGSAACRMTVFDDDDYAEDLPSPALSALSTLDADADAAGHGVCRSYRLAVQTVRGVGIYAVTNLFIHEPPSRPGTPTATTDENGARIDLAWRASAFAGGSPILGYEILRQIDGRGDFVSIAFSPGTATRYVDSPATAEAHSVRYRVRARNAAGDGELSVASNALNVPAASFLVNEVFSVADIVNVRDRRLDIYFVINNNNRDMNNYQQKLGESFASFIDNINADPWRLFITSSYFTKSRVGGFAAKLAHPDDVPTSHFITSADTDVAEKFSAAMLEMRLSSLRAQAERPRRALSPLAALQLSVAGGPDYFRGHPVVLNNESFWRRIDRQTPMAVIVVSNEPERMIDTRHGAHHLDRASPDLNRLKASLSLVKDEFLIYPLLIDSARMLDGVGRFSPSQRQRAFAEAADKPRLRAAAAATSGAVFVAGADFSETMRRLATYISVTLLDAEQVALGGAPHPDYNVFITFAAASGQGQRTEWDDYSVMGKRIVFTRPIPESLHSGLVHISYHKTRPGR